MIKNSTVKDLIEFDRQILPTYCKLIAGIDEAGRGPLAGPVVAAAVILPDNIKIDGIYDSKALTPLQRERAFDKVVSLAFDIGIGIIPPEIIDQINILQATIKAMEKALGNLLLKPDYVLTDAVYLPSLDEVSQKSIIKGDQKSYSIAAASIVAKVIRDRLMNMFHYKYPVYNFACNKGYGTKEHIEALSRVGPCPLHRRTFKRVKEYCV